MATLSNPRLYVTLRYTVDDSMSYYNVLPCAYALILISLNSATRQSCGVRFSAN